MRIRRRILGYQPNTFDTHVRLTHPQIRSTSAPVESDQRSRQSGGRRRVIHGIDHQSYEDYYRQTRKRSFQPHFESLLYLPFWKKRDLGSLSMSPESPPPPMRDCEDSALSQVGDSLKGNAPNDLILTPGHVHLRRRLRRMFLSHDSDSEDEVIEDPFTALGADPEPGDGSIRKVSITSGFVALGLVQAGSTLAASVGGSIGPDILVKSESIDKMDKLTPMPTAPQDTVATGVDLQIS
jgi:hypothetical protein